jgi:hypothetical protein
MNALQIKLATAIAQDTTIDLSKENDGVLYGCGLPDFERVAVSIRCVAKLMRWQCQCLDGSWDWKQFNEDLPSYRDKMTIIDLDVPELRGWLRAFVEHRLELAQAA